MSKVKGNAAVTWTETGGASTERVFLLPAPLWEQVPSHAGRVHARDSLDLTTREVFTHGAGADELTCMVRFSHDPQGLLDLIKAGASNTTLTLYPDIRDTGDSHSVKLISPLNGRHLERDADTSVRGDMQVTLRFRRTDQGPFASVWFHDELFRFLPGQRMDEWTVTRAGTSYYRSKGPGVLSSATSGIARIHWMDLDGDRHAETPVLWAERATTNLVPDSADFSAWSDNGAAVTGSQADPAGGTSADLLEDNDGAATESRWVTVAAADTDGVISCFIKYSTAGACGIGLHDNTAGAWRHLIRATFNNGVPTLATVDGSGTLLPVQPYQNGWYRIAATVTSISTGNANRFYVYPANPGSAADTGHTFFYGAQYEDTVTGESSYIPTSAGAAARIVDTMSRAWAEKPQAMTVYTRFIDQGGWGFSAARVWSIGTTGGSAPRLILEGDGTAYRAGHSNGLNTVQSVASGVPAIGDTVEILVQLNANGSVTIVQSINGAAVTSVGPSTAAAIAQDWETDIVYLGSDNGSNAGFLKLLNMHAVRGTVDMPTMRRRAGVR